MELNELIYLQSPWLRDSSYLPREQLLPKRKIFPRLFEEITSLPQITSLIGIRRTGKSTLLKQIIARLLKEEDRKKILYFSFDQPTVEENIKTLEDIITYYFQKIVNCEISQLTDKVYLFFDEIQLVPSWQNILKRYYDLNKKIKFIISGSSSLFLFEKAKESLAGRIFTKYLAPLSFSEYKEIFKDVDFEEFLNFGQFPEFLEIKDKEKKIEYLKEGVIGKVLDIDIAKAYKIRKTLDFERLFWTILPNTGQIIKSSQLMTDLGLKKATFFKYLTILEKSLLVNKVLNLSGSFRSEKRLLRKIYPASSNFLILTPAPVSAGFKAETYVASLLKEKYSEIFLYNQRGKEIDFLLPEVKTAIEVKYQEKIHLQDYQFLSDFTKEKGYQGILVVKNPITLPKGNIQAYAIEELEEKLLFLR